MASADPLRQYLVRLLNWQDAHVSFDDAVEGLPPELRGRRPPGVAHSPWELIEHIRLAQHDILDFCRNPDYRELSWPDDYWPPDAAPPSAEAWDASLAAFRDDRAALGWLAEDPYQSLASSQPTVSDSSRTSVTNMQPGLCVIISGGRDAAATACGVTPHAQNTGSSPSPTGTGSP